MGALAIVAGLLLAGVAPQAVAEVNCGGIGWTTIGSASDPGGDVKFERHKTTGHIRIGWDMNPSSDAQIVAAHYAVVVHTDTGPFTMDGVRDVQASNGCHEFTANFANQEVTIWFLGGEVLSDDRDVVEKCQITAKNRVTAGGEVEGEVEFTKLGTGGEVRARAYYEQEATEEKSCGTDVAYSSFSPRHLVSFVWVGQIGPNEETPDPPPAAIDTISYQARPIIPGITPEKNCELASQTGLPRASAYLNFREYTYNEFGLSTNDLIGVPMVLACFYQGTELRTSYMGTVFWVSVPDGFNHVILYVQPFHLDETTGDLFIGTTGTLTYDARWS